MATPFERLRHGLGALLSGPAPASSPPPAPAPTMKADAETPTPSSMGGTNASSSGYRNPFSGLGLSTDMATQARPNVNRLRLSDEELVAAGRDGLLGRIVELKPNYATRKGWQLDGDGSERITARMGQLRAKARFRDADKWGGQLGEARVLMVTDDPMPMHLPLIPRTVKRVHALQVIDKREFSPRTWCTDMRNPLFGQPETYHVHPIRPGGARMQVVHASRLVRFYGNPLPPSAGIENETFAGGADAIGQRIWDALRNMAQTTAAQERLALELSVAVFKIGSMKQQKAGDHRERFLSRTRMMAWTKSVANSVLLGPNDSYERVSANPSGFKDLSENAQRYLALVLGYPLVLLFGQSPGGLNADGESWQAHWRDTVAQHQEDRYREPLEDLVEILHYEVNGTDADPPEYALTFNPLGELTPKEEADVRLVNAQRDEIYMRNQVYGAQRVGEYRFGEEGYQEIGPPVEEPEADLDARAAALMDGRADAGMEFHDVPKGVSEDAALGLELREKFNRGMPAPEGGGPATGALTAGKLKRGKVSDEDVLLMVAWRARHGAQLDRRKEGWGDREDPAPQWISWLGWGGDDADAWLDRLEPGARKRVGGG